MPYRVLTHSDLMNMSMDTAGITESMESALSDMEEQGYALVQYVAPYVTAQNTSMGTSYSEPRFIFHKGPRTVLDDLREKYADKF